MPRREWTRDELIIVFNLYCKIPFGRIHIRNPQVIALARIIGRTPSAVSWKLANFARLDPALQKRKIAGASHGSRAEIEIWDEFNNDWEQLSFESERLVQKLVGRTDETVEREMFPEGLTRESVVRTRINQDFFRAAVLAAYRRRCCITGLSVERMLTASHIVPWSVDLKNRTNPRNGLCLNPLHDRAFDCGLMTVTTEFKVKISPKVARSSADLAERELLWKYEGAQITLPQHFPPDPDFLRYHNQQIFVG